MPLSGRKFNAFMRAARAARARGGKLTLAEYERGHQPRKEQAMAKSTAIARIPRNEVIVPRSVVTAAISKGKRRGGGRRRSGGGLELSGLVRGAVINGGKAVLYVELQKRGMTPATTQAVMAGIGALGMSMRGRWAKEAGKSLVDTAEFLFALDKYSEYSGGTGIQPPGAGLNPQGFRRRG